MTNYQCPECGGKFPTLTKWEGNLACPWCYNTFLRHHSSPDYELQRMTYKERKEDGDV